MGLNAYRSNALLNSSSNFAEAFFQAPLNDYMKLFSEFFKSFVD